MLLEINVSMISDLKVLSMSIVHKIINKLRVKNSFSINDIILTSCFKDLTPTLLQCYWRFTNFIIALINPTVHKIINELLAKNSFSINKFISISFSVYRSLLFRNRFIFSKGVFLESELLNFLIYRVKHGSHLALMTDS